MPDTSTCLSAAATSLFAAVIVTSPVLVLRPARIVSVVFELRAKSDEVAGDTADADTTTVTASCHVLFRAAVTVLAPPSSEISAGVSFRLTVGR